VLQPHIELHRRPREIYHQTVRKSEYDKADLHSSVLEFAKCAETLTVAASLKNANQILLDERIIEVLQQSVRRLTILSCSDRKSFSVMREVARNLVGDGAVHELCVGHCMLSSDLLKELLEFGISSGGCSVDPSISEDSEVINSCTRDKYDSVDNSDVTDSPGILSDLYDVALQPCGADLFPTASSSVLCCSCSRRSDLSQRTGIRALSVINFKSTSGSIDAMLCEVLPRLCRLEKLALIGLTEMNISRTFYLCRTSDYLCTQIQCGQLSHVVIDGCLLPGDFLSKLLSALMRRCRYVMYCQFKFCGRLCMVDEKNWIILKVYNSLIQNCSLTPDKLLNIFIYGLPFYIQGYGNKLFKMIQFSGSPCVFMLLV